jgi:hypothetical protein
MRQLGILVAAVVLAGTVGACVDPYYRPYRSYAYSSDYYYPDYYSGRPVYYSSRPYPSYYDSNWDYYRHYNGIHSSAEVMSM